MGRTRSNDRQLPAISRRGSWEAQARRLQGCLASLHAQFALDTADRQELLPLESKALRLEYKIIKLKAKMKEDSGY